MSRIFFLFFFVFAFLGCKQSTTPDVSNINTDVKIVRTETKLNDIKTKAQLEQLIIQYPAFYDIYIKKIISVYDGENLDTLFKNFNNFVSDSLVNDLTQKVTAKYNSVDKLKAQLDRFYQYLQYYFPDQSAIPNFYTFISEFGYQVFIFEDDGNKDGIAIGLDMFMHPEIDYKMIDPDNTNFSDYVTRSWNKDHVVKKIADLHVNDIAGDSPGNRLIDHMIHNGKILYITDLLLPEVHDTIIHEYSGAQLDWCYENELQMWSFFFDQKLFYEANPTKIAKYIYPSPKSPDMPDAAPGRTANFIGWQIIKAYMDRHPETTITELINLTDSQLIMEKSKYKPKQKK
jgi:hypothetical protein